MGDGLKDMGAGQAEQPRQGGTSVESLAVEELVRRRAERERA
ncbi:hypothetical protein [Microbispora triticiradicis]|nr:hypothetical protein [Microbispora triticiradicis]